MVKRPFRIFQIAKELNISHTEILSFLKGIDVAVASHMSPVDHDTYQVILTEFAKDKEKIDRYRKEQVRREIHDTRVRREQLTTRKLTLLSLTEQRQLEERERERAIHRAKEEEQRRLEEARRRAEEEKKQKEEAELKKKEVAKEKTKKHKLRKVDLSEIQAQIGQTTRKKRLKKEPTTEEAAVQQSAKDRVRQTLAKIDTKSRKKVYKKDKHEKAQEIPEEELHTIQIAEFASVEEIAKLFNTTSSGIIQKCFSVGVLASINQRLEWDVIELLSEEYGFVAEKLSEIGEELFSLKDSEEDITNAEPRSPVVTIMGHVDHGKTSLLDYIRNTNVVAGESGGITQHIGAYKVELDNKGTITFIDTPGHEAFTAMRARGANITDIVVLVIAADDSVMPQTIEAIDHARAANVPIVVAINKIDKPGVDVEKVKRELSEYNVLIEDWGGKVQSISVSAKTGEGIDDLLNAIMLEAEMLELKVNRNCFARGTVIDSRLDKGHGPMASVLIQKGILSVGDPFICNDFAGKVRAIMNERDQRIKDAYPSDVVQLLGFEQVPQVADIFAVVENERDLKRVSAERQRLRREIDQKRIATHSLDTISALIKEGSIRNLQLIIKGDADGSIEALSESLDKMNFEEVGVNIIHKGVGMVTESDVLLAEASKAVIIGFHVQIASNAKLQAKQAGIEIRTYNIIYNAVEEIKMALEGMLEPEELEEVRGSAVVQAQFKIPKIGFIAGSRVTEGIITRGDRVRLIRADEVLYDGIITSLKRLKDDAKEVKEGMECGIGIEGFSKFEEGDTIQVYEIKKIKRKLEAN